MPDLFNFEEAENLESARDAMSQTCSELDALEEEAARNSLYSDGIPLTVTLTTKFPLSEQLEIIHSMANLNSRYGLSTLITIDKGDARRTIREFLQEEIRIDLQSLVNLGEEACRETVRNVFQGSEVVDTTFLIDMVRDLLENKLKVASEEEIDLDSHIPEFRLMFLEFFSCLPNGIRTLMLREIPKPVIVGAAYQDYYPSGDDEFTDYYGYLSQQVDFWTELFALLPEDIKNLDLKNAEFSFKDFLIDEFFTQHKEVPEAARRLCAGLSRFEHLEKLTLDEALFYTSKFGGSLEECYRILCFFPPAIQPVIDLSNVNDSVKSFFQQKLEERKKDGQIMANTGLIALQVSRISQLEGENSRLKDALAENTSRIDTLEKKLKLIVAGMQLWAGGVGVNASSDTPFEETEDHAYLCAQKAAIFGGSSTADEQSSAEEINDSDEQEATTGAAMTLTRKQGDGSA